MIATQRKAHKFIWLTIALALPILLFLSARNLDFSLAEKDGPKKQLVAKMEGEKIQIQLNSPLASPSALVYELTSNGKSPDPLGQLKGTGNYTFSASKDSKGILVIDKIKNEELFKIQF